MNVETEKSGGGVTAAPVIPDGIAILGSHPATVMMAPFNDNWLIYACSPHNFEHRKLPRIDEWFEVHVPIADQTRAYNYLKYLETLPKVWMRDKEAMPNFPGAVPFPEEEYKKVENFGPFHFTSSIAYIMARAIKVCEEQGIKNIGLFGIMQASENEYAYQRPGIQYMILEAVRRGIKVVAPDVSKLFDPTPDNW